MEFSRDVDAKTENEIVVEFYTKNPEFSCLVSVDS